MLAKVQVRIIHSTSNFNKAYLKTSVETSDRNTQTNPSCGTSRIITTLPLKYAMYSYNSQIFSLTNTRQSYKLANYIMIRQLHI